MKLIVSALKARRIYRDVRNEVDGYEEYARGVRDFGFSASRIRYAGSRVKSMAQHGLNAHEAYVVWGALKDIGVRKGSRLAHKTWRSYAKKKAAQED